MKVFKINASNSSLLNQLNGTNNGTVLFYHPQCGHCQSMKPQWEKMKKRLFKKNCNIYEVNGEHMDDMYHPMKEVVNGFPTILNVNNGKLTSFEKERNTQNMIHFVLSNEKEETNNVEKAKNHLSKRKVAFHLNENDDLIKQRRVLKSKNIMNSILLANKKAALAKSQQKTTKTQNKKKPITRTKKTKTQKKKKDIKKRRK